MSINVNDKNLGHATAYAYYKAGGGTMTEAEFTEFMADFGTASQTAVEAAQAALASKNAAQTAATTATNKATEATTAATTATTKAGEASTSASTATSAKDTAVSASQTATTKATEATTAAATATSAKTDAVAANTAAQSAKTAAQTAQTGAETAAASVQSSAAQIQTNAEDISQLKSEISEVIPTNSPTLTWEDGKVINVPNGGITNNDTMSMSRYNALNDYTELSVNWTYNNQYVGSVCFYEQTGASTYVKKGDIVTSVTAGQKITVPDGATHFGVSRLTADKNGAQVKLYKSNIGVLFDAVEGIESDMSSFVDYESLELTWTTGKYVSPNGAIANSSTFGLSNLIDVHDVESLVFNLSQSLTVYVAPIGFYKGNPLDQNYITGNFISVSGFTKNTPLSVPKGANYAVLGIQTGNTSYITAKAKKTERIKQLDFLTGKNEVGVLFGDSIIEGVGVLPANGGMPLTNVSHDMMRLTGHTVYNAGIGGTKMTDTADANFCELIDAIVDNDWTAIDARIAEMIARNISFTSLMTTIGEIKTLDFSTVDYIVVGYGTNDWASDNTVGDISSTDKTDFTGAFKYAINKLLTAYPHLRVYVVAPGYRRDTGNTETDTHQGKTLAEYSEGITALSNRLGFPCLNLYAEGMVNRYNYAHFLADSVHRNIKGYELLAQQFCKFVHSR